MPIISAISARVNPSEANCITWNSLCVSLCVIVVLGAHLVYSAHLLAIALEIFLWRVEILYTALVSFAVALRVLLQEYDAD